MLRAKSKQGVTALAAGIVVNTKLASRTCTDAIFAEASGNEHEPVDEVTLVGRWASVAPLASRK